VVAFDRPVQPVPMLARLNRWSLTVHAASHVVGTAHHTKRVSTSAGQFTSYHAKDVSRWSASLPSQPSLDHTMPSVVDGISTCASPFHAAVAKRRLSRLYRAALRRRLADLDDNALASRIAAQAGPESSPYVSSHSHAPASASDERLVTHLLPHEWLGVKAALRSPPRPT